MSDRAKIGILGGSFDPIHLGHLMMAENARDQLDLDQVLFAPAGNPPHKPNGPRASFEHRLAMVGLAIAGNPPFAATDIDRGVGGRSFTWQLLERCQERYPDSRFWFILGGDSLVEFHSWARPGRILELARLAAIERPGSNEGQAPAIATEPNLAQGVDVIRAPLFAVSSSDIRQRISRQESIRYLIPDAVMEYIDRHGLYRDAPRQAGS